jgi:hypothetical protein
MAILSFDSLYEIPYLVRNSLSSTQNDKLILDYYQAMNGKYSLEDIRSMQELWIMHEEVSHTHSQIRLDLITIIINIIMITVNQTCIIPFIPI